MNNAYQVAKELLVRNEGTFDRDIDEFAKWLSENYTIEELTDINILKPCSICGGQTEVVSMSDEDGAVFSVDCLKCKWGGEIYLNKDFAILSHNTNSWFDDGLCEYEDE